VLLASLLLAVTACEPAADRADAGRASAAPERMRARHRAADHVTSAGEAASGRAIASASLGRTAAVRR
jgi:hypothetical protein